MNAIIVPGVTDLNKGDQALVWESWRLAKDTGLYDEVYILDAGDNDEERELLCRQSEEHGFKLLENILKHPRRGQHKSGEHIKESRMELFKQIKNAAMDFKDTRYLLKICNDLEKVRKNFDDKTYRTVKQFHQAKTIFVKGGGFIHAYGEKTAPYLMWYFLFYVRLAKALGKKVVFLPNSYGPFIGLTVEKQVRSVFGKLDLVYARENVSAQSLGQLMGKEIPVEMDLGFFLEKGSQEEAVKILQKYKLSKEDKIVGVTIRPWRFPGLSNPEALYKKYISSVADLTRHLLAKGYKVALCNQSLGPNSHEDDRNAIRDLLAQVQDPNIIWINENLSCDLLKAVYSNFYFFIGTRFHSIIFSLTSLVPSIAIGYGGNKAKGIMGDFRLDDYVVQIQDVESDQLINMFDKAISEYDNIKNQLNQSMGLVSASRNRLIHDIKSLY
ncbi:polysaccharide pyruvyl transferase family protein [Chryseobacterium takakiae]|uniref:Colanic acid/amylovoran biosynthesis protein n=1 Tax=Chryseobacterium takakiae TaxID=1302685 RepID=A0A1M4TM46_9FLAO|nr:polysaccharide pyruvyl transferase family protein [Chryseobacterium takakiae]SHE45562.1 colanic acid/amylovoran biosynthesis protein [Chryseobacterium takakiae]